jgi:hypothetical protein
MHLIISKTFLKDINFLTFFFKNKIKLKRKRQEKYLECEINAQKDKEQDKSKSSQEITHKMPKREILVG